MKPKREPAIFYIVRHGETVWNTEKRMQGHKDSPLTENGKIQAQQTAQKLKNVSFDQVFSSDLLRAKRTAEIIAADVDLAIKTSRLLRESTLGPFEGKKVSFFQKSLQKSIEYRQSLPSDKRMLYKVHPEIESYEESATRMLTFLRMNAIAYPGETILVVSHSNIIRSSLVKLGFASDEELPHGSVKNASYVKIESDGVDFFIRETDGVEKGEIN